jgi:hypothetical protein
MVTESAFERVAKIQKKAGAILTGGALVQLLSRGRFLTADVDLVLGPDESEERVVEVLRELGFIRKGTYWLDEEGDDIYQLIPENYFGREMGVRHKGSKLRTVCLEYLVANRLMRCKKGEAKMCEQALYLLSGFGRDLNMPYLKEFMERFGVDDSFLRKSKLLRLLRVEPKRS